MRKSNFSEEFKRDAVRQIAAPAVWRLRKVALARCSKAANRSQNHVYTSDGRMPIDNNILEREIRVFATGRKSWLFSDTVDGAKASAVIYSLMLTCRACGVDPLSWLRHVLTELPQREETADIGDLLPFNFSRANAQ